MEKRHILIVDDSALIRRLVSLVVEQEADLEPIAAQSGAAALAKIEKSRPHLVVLDVEMPEMDGLQTLGRIRLLDPSLPVIMFSALTEAGSTAAMEALARGAMDCLLKPSQSNGLEDAMEYVRSTLLVKVRGILRLPGSATPGTPLPGASALAPKPPARPTAAVSKAPPRARVRSTLPAELVVIGVSTGGPNALAEVVRSFPKDFAQPILIVQHMPPMFTRLLAERLDALCPLSCREALDGEEVGPGDLRIAPGNFHMTVGRREKRFLIRLTQDPPENSCRPSVDVLFRHAAASCGNRVLAAVLTGMGQDGMLGAECIRAEGGLVLVQDEATSVVWGMPGAVASAGFADAVLPLRGIGPELVRRARNMGD